MSKFKIVRKLADSLGTSTAKAGRFVDDVGAPAAKRITDDLQSGGSKAADWLTAKKTGALLGTGAVGGGALAWREQDVRKAQQLAERSESYKGTIQAIMESDLPADMKKKLVEEATKTNQGDGNGDDDDETPWYKDIFPDGESPMQMVLMVVIVAIVLRTVLEGDN